PVLEDWSACGAAVLIALQCAALSRKVIPGVEQVVTHKFKQVAVEVVSARFGHGADLGTTSGSSLLSADFRLEFDQRMREGKGQRQAVERIDITSAVQRVLCRGPKPTCGGDCQSAANGVSTGRSDQLGRPIQQDKLLRISAIERKFHDP